jgi:CspA family cold shock protein
MPTGTVKWFDPARGYGFIGPDEGNVDVFVHISVVEEAGLSILTDGQKVEYEVVSKPDGKTAAGNLKLVD